MASGQIIPRDQISLAVSARRLAVKTGPSSSRIIFSLRMRDHTL